MRILHLGDLHIGKNFESKSLLEDQKFVLEQVLETLKEKQIDVMVIAGDIYDRSIPKEEAVKLYDWFISESLKNQKLNILVISGNHDSAIRLGQLNTLLSAMRYHVVSQFNKPLDIIKLNDEFGVVEFYMMPYLDSYNIRKIWEIEEKENDDVYKHVLKDISSENRKVLVAHNFFTPMNGDDLETSESERTLTVGGQDYISSSVLENFNYVALGHLHKAQKAGKDYIRYSGTLLKYSLSEMNHKKTMTIVDLDENGTANIELLPVKSQRDVREIRGYFNEISRTSYDDKKDDFLSIILEDDEKITDAYSSLSKIYPNILSISYPNIENKEFAFSTNKEDLNLDTFSLFNKFIKSKLDRELTEDESKVMIEIIERVEKENDSN